MDFFDEEDDEQQLGKFAGGLGVPDVGGFGYHYSDNPDVQADKAYAKSSVSGYLPQSGEPIPGDLDSEKSVNFALFRNKQMLDANETKFNKLSLEGGKEDESDVGQMVAQALLAFVPIAGGYLLGGNRGGVAGARAGLVGQKTFQDTLLTTEKKKELKRAGEQAGLLTEREKLLKERGDYEKIQIKGDQSKENQALNLSNQLRMIGASSAASVAANKAKLGQQTEEYLKRRELGLGGDGVSNEGYATQAQINEIAAMAREAGNDRLASLLENTPEGSIRTRELLQSSRSLTEAKLAPNAVLEAAAIGSSSPVFLDSIGLPQMLKEQTEKGPGGIAAKAVPFSERRKLANALGRFGLELAVIVQGSRPTDKDAEIITRNYNEEAIASGQAFNTLKGDLLRAKTKLQSYRNQVASVPAYRASVAELDSGIASYDSLLRQLTGEQRSSGALDWLLSE